MLYHIKVIAAETDTKITSITHDGDGNLYLLMIAERGDDATLEQA